MYCTPGALSSILISTEKAVPIKPANKANIRYKVPMSLALDDQNHLSKNIDTELNFVLSVFILYLRNLTQITLIYVFSFNKLVIFN